MNLLGKRLMLGLLPLFVFSLLSWPLTAEAHKGHGGSVITFINQKTVLKALLPADAKLVKRKEKLSSARTEWAEKTLAIDLDNRVHVYFRANDRSSGELLGGAIIMKYAYRHGDVILAVGIDAQQTVTAVAIQGISEKYIPDFEAAFGTGLLSGYEGKTVEDLVRLTETVAADKPTRFFNRKLAETAAMIAAFLHDAASH